jgi:microcystin-dependent protein
MAAPITADWANHVVSNDSLNATTYGQGTSFPSTYNVTRLFWRTDLERMYFNKGTEGTPIWEGADIPVGTVNMYAGAVADIPNGWLLCNGTAVSRTTYAQLFAVLDTEYGVGDGATTFNVPDFVTTNKFPRAATNDAGRGGTGGESTHTLTSSESGTTAHGHGVTDPGHIHGSAKGNGVSQGGGGSTPTGAYQDTTSSTTGLTVNDSSAASASSAHENKPPYLDIHFIIAV